MKLVCTVRTGWRGGSRGPDGVGGSVVACHPRPTAAGLVAEVRTSARIAAPARIAGWVVPPRSPFRGNVPNDGGGVRRGLVGGLCLGRGISWTLPTGLALALALAPDLLVVAAEGGP